MPETEGESSKAKATQGVAREPDKDTDITTLTTLLQTLTEVAAKGSLAPENDERYKEQLSQIQKSIGRKHHKDCVKT